MCGIAGIIHPDAESRQDLVCRMLDRIRHRGHDDTGLWHDQGCVLGHARLSIIDLSETGHQPLGNEDGTVWVALNGEIYNYQELREDLLLRGHRLRGTSDTEVLPHLYEEYGVDFVEHLRGMFAIALWDARRRRLVLARDRAGKKPLYYAPVAGGIAFASEMKSLFVLPSVDISIREQAIHDYLSFGAVPGTGTAYCGIHRVPAAHILVFEDGAPLRAACYWSPAFTPKHDISREEAVEEILHRLREAVRLRLRSDVRVGCLLSGGIDSGLVTALAAEASETPLRTYSIGFEDAAFDERGPAARVAKEFGTDHTEYVLSSRVGDEIPDIVSHYDEPFADPSMVPSFAVAKLAASDIKVVLNGDGADEVFAGYRHFVAARKLAGLDRAGAALYRPAAGALLGRLPAPGRGRSPYQFLHRTLRALACTGGERYLVLTSDGLSEVEKKNIYGNRGFNTGKLDNSLRNLVAVDAELGPVDAMLLRDFHHLLGEQHLVKMDMASMAHTLEARSPFLDHELIEFVARLPETYKLAGGETKPLLRTLAKRLLPDQIAALPKRGFEIPLQRWMQHDLNATLTERVMDPASYAMTHFDASEVANLLLGEGWDAKRWAGVTWSLLCLEIWWDNYRRNICPAAAKAEREPRPGGPAALRA